MQLRQLIATLASLCVIIYAVAVGSPDLRLRGLSTSSRPEERVYQIQDGVQLDDAALVLESPSGGTGLSTLSPGSEATAIGIYDDKSLKSFFHKVKQVAKGATKEVGEAAKEWFRSKLPWRCDKACAEWGLPKAVCMVRCRLLGIPIPAIWIWIP